MQIVEPARQKISQHTHDTKNSDCQLGCFSSHHRHPYRWRHQGYRGRTHRESMVGAVHGNRNFIVGTSWCPSSTGRLICPTGSLRGFVSSPVSKNISLRRWVETAIHQANPVPIRGAFRDRHGRWARDAVDATASQRKSLRGRTVLTRTAKSCGPDVSTLASSLAVVTAR